MDLNIEFITYDEIKKSSMEEIIKKVIKDRNKIIIIDRKLKPEEEVKIIENVMSHITGKDVKGIEIVSLSKEYEGKGLLEKIKKVFGKNKGLTIIGNANTIKEIKKRKEGALLRL